jgi:hypothetical protein
VDLRPGVAVVPATQAIHLSNSSKVTSTSTCISARTAVPEAVSSAPVPSKQPAGRKSVSASEQPGTLPFCPSNQLEQPSSPSASRRPHMLLLWRTKPLGDALSKEGNSVAASSQYPSKTRSTTVSTRRLWSCLQPWKGEPPGG